MKRLPIYFVLIFSMAYSEFSPAADKPVTPTIDQKTVPGTIVPTATQKKASTSPESMAIQDGYIIQPGDVLEISVWKEKDLQRDVLVRPDGKLTFPLVGDIVAAGLTYEHFKKNLVAKLSRYVPRPSVTVSLKQALGNKIFVIGKVNRPGEFINSRNLDVMQALSLAGGLNSFASEKNIRVLRRENGKLNAIKFNYKSVKKGKNLKQNIILQSGDVVVVY